MTAMELGHAPEFLAAFLDEAVKRMPGTAWRKISDYVLSYPESSLSLGDLSVSFEWDEITVYCWQHHQHFTLIDGRFTDGAHQAAARALGFIQDVLNDRIVIRWGVYGSRALRTDPSRTLLARLWRILTPWVRQAVWSGQARA
jgi:hypothetical protein